MTPDERKAWIATLKVGDVVAVRSTDRWGLNEQRWKSTVARITPTGKLRVEGYAGLFGPGTRNLEPWTPELAAQALHQWTVDALWHLLNAGPMDRTKLAAAPTAQLTALLQALRPFRRHTPTRED